MWEARDRSLRRPIPCAKCNSHCTSASERRPQVMLTPQDQTGQKRGSRQRIDASRSDERIRGSQRGQDRVPPGPNRLTLLGLFVSGNVDRGTDDPQVQPVVSSGRVVAGIHLKGKPGNRVANNGGERKFLEV